MAMHHYMKHAHTVHRHLRHAGRSLLVKAAEHHPILTSALAIVGGVSLLKLVSSKKSTTDSSSTVAL